MPVITSSSDQEYLLRGVTAGLVPSLVGKVVFENDTPFRLKSLKSAPGVMTQQVTRANGTGLLTFAYRIDLTETDYDAELFLTVKLPAFGLLLSFADFRVDGPGVQPPNTFKVAQLEGYTFKFSHGLCVGGGSRFCFFSTNAREFNESGGSLKLHTGMKSISLDVASPTATAPQRWTEAKEPAEMERAKSREPDDASSPGTPEPSK